ncbi:MAG: helix-turn-helix domain-containing protein [Bacillaceae bacterium]
MFENIGPKIRELRLQKGINLNEFAKEIDISQGHLSELETGKAKSIKFSVLERLQTELHIFPEDGHTAFSDRIKRIELQLVKLDAHDPLYAEHLLHQMESGIEWFLNSAKKSSD